MNKTTLKKRVVATVLSLGIVSFLAVPMLVHAADNTNNYGLNTGFNSIQIGKNNDLKGQIGQIINIILGFLGIIAVIIILAGGFKWMTAGGNEDKVGEARKMIIQGVIGLVVIFAAWAIASFVISSLVTATNA